MAHAHAARTGFPGHVRQGTKTAAATKTAMDGIAASKPASSLVGLGLVSGDGAAVVGLVSVGAVVGGAAPS